jgi:hypothetical protein
VSRGAGAVAGPLRWSGAPRSITTSAAAPPARHLQ